MTDMLVNIDVEDLGTATDFYCRALDLRIGRRLGSSVVELLGASSPIYLLQKPAGSVASDGVSQRRDYGRHWTPVHLDFVVQDIESAVGRVQAAGGRLEDKVRTQKWGRIALMTDPFGNGFCLIEFLGRGYDEVAS